MKTESEPDFASSFQRPAKLGGSFGENHSKEKNIKNLDETSLNGAQQLGSNLSKTCSRFIDQLQPTVFDSGSSEARDSWSHLLQNRWWWTSNVKSVPRC